MISYKLNLTCLVFRRERTWQIIDYMRSAGGRCIQKDIARHLRWSQPLTNQYFTDMVVTGLAHKTGGRDRGCMVFELNENKIEQIQKALEL